MMSTSEQEFNSAIRENILDDRSSKIIGKFLLKYLCDEELTTGELIKAKRIDSDLTLRELEKLSGIPAPTLYRLENDNAPVTAHTATKLGQALKIHPITILFPNGIQ